MSCLWPNLLYGHDDYGLWHVIWRHRSSMHHVEEVECSCWEERIRYVHFQGVHGGWCIRKLEWCLHYLWDWRSYNEDGWQKANLFFPLDSIFWQTHQATNCSKFHDQHKALYYDYKKATSLEEIDLWYATFNTHLKQQARAPFKSSIIGSIYSTFMCDNGEVSCWM
jgi:hypothetical protein